MMNAGWILDSGATDHMTYDKTLFQSMTRPYRKCVATANGSTAAVVGAGTVSLTPSLPYIIVYWFRHCPITYCLYLKSLNNWIVLY